MGIVLINDIFDHRALGSSGKYTNLKINGLHKGWPIPNTKLQDIQKIMKNGLFYCVIRRQCIEAHSEEIFFAFIFQDGLA